MGYRNYLYIADKKKLNKIRNMNKEVACCNCGRKIRYNETYTSRRIMTVTGFGYAECPECYFSYFKEQIYGKNNR